MVTIGKDAQGLPTRLSVPGLSRKVPAVVAGRRLGEVDPSGAVKWTLAGSQESWHEYVAQSDALKKATRARRRLRAAIIDGDVAAIVVPSRRTSTATAHRRGATFELPAQLRTIPRAGRVQPTI